MKCTHSGHFTPRVYIDRNPDGRFLARIGLRCADCGEWFEFLGVPPGKDPNGASVSPDRKELRIAIGTTTSMEEYYARAIEAIRPKVIQPDFREVTHGQGARIARHSHP